MKEIVGFLACLAAVVVILDPTTAKVDRRFRTGYKNNEVPVHTPWSSRLRRAGFLACLAFLCFAAPSTLVALAGGAAALVGLIATWHLYPQFWSRYQRNGTSNAKFLAARTSMTLAIGGLAGYTAFQAASSMSTGDPSTAVPPTTASTPATVRPKPSVAAAAPPDQRRAPPPAPEPRSSVESVATSSQGPSMPLAHTAPTPTRVPAARSVSNARDEDDADGDESSARVAESPRGLLGPGVRGIPGVRPRSEIPFPPAYARGALRSNANASADQPNARDQSDVGPMGEGP